MQKAVRYGKRWEGFALPNPGVVAIIVKDERDMSIAQHRAYGGPHAERLALGKVGKRARGATMYLTLEPCCHQGKTPPCTDAILKAGIKRVVVGARDPNLLVNGKGMRMLERHGIQVEKGVLQKECEWLHRKYLFSLGSKRPFVSLKWAMTMDGKIADASGASRYLTGEKALREAHRLRANHSAVMVGIQTVLKDDPLLLPSRLPGPVQKAKKVYVRIVLDSRGRFPEDARLAKTARESPVWVFGGNWTKMRRKALEKQGVRCIELHRQRNGVPLEAVLDRLHEEGIRAVLVEGGSKLLGSFVDSGLYDAIHVFLVPKLMGGLKATTPVGGRGLPLSKLCHLLLRESKKIGKDFYFHMERI